MVDVVMQLSIPHSGTALLRQAFTQAGYSLAGIQEAWMQAGAKVLKWGHILNPSRFSEQRDLVESSELTVIPFRHPWRLEESWRRRSRPRNLLWSGLDFVAQLLDHPNVIIVPVDRFDRRDMALEAIRARGVDLTVDWDRQVNTNEYGEKPVMNAPISQLNPSYEAVQAAKLFKEIYA